MSSTPAENISPKQQVKLTLILFFAIAGGVLFFMLVSLFINQVNGPLAPELLQHSFLFKAILAVVAVTCLATARWLFGKNISSAKNSLNSLSDKLNQYRSALILYLALCEAPVLLGTVLFLMTGDFSFLIFGAVLLGFMLVMAPVKKKVAEQLGLDWQQQQELE